MRLRAFAVARRPCFLIDLEREVRRGPGVRTSSWSGIASVRHATIAGEFGEGFGDLSDPACQAMLARYLLLPMDKSTAGSYARIAHELRKQNRLIGVNDLWIAAAALALSLPLVTNNAAHFSRISGLSVMAY